MRTLLLLGTAVSLGCGTADSPILLGLAGPFSQPRGVAMERAAQLAAQEINARGGVRGRPLELLVIDDSARSEVAIQAAQTFYTDLRVVAVVGHLTSGTTLKAAGVYNSGPTPLVSISPSASAPRITWGRPYTFRVCPSDDVHGAELARWARERLGASRAVILFHNDEYGRGVRATFAAQFTAAGGEVADLYPYVPEVGSFAPYAEHAWQAARADVIMIAGARREGVRLLPALRAVGFRLPVLAADGLSGIENEGDLAEGVYVSSAWLPDRPSERSQRFVEAYRLAFRGDLPDHRGAGAYDIVHLLAQAIAAVGPDREGIRRYLSQVGQERPPFEGVTGITAFDVNGDVEGKAVLIGVVRDGRLLTAGSL